MSGILTEQSGTVRRVGNARMPTKWGMFRAMGFEREISNGSRRTETALALVLGDVTEDAPLLRIHSQCFTGEMLGSLRCDCGEQLRKAIRAIAAAGRGLVIYEYQEGRGIGLMAKLRAYALQDAGLDTVEANHALGFKVDCRDFSLPAAILCELGVRQVRLLSNNPNKTRALLAAGIEVVEQVSCEVAPTKYSLDYLRTKKEKLGHTLALVSSTSRREKAASKIPHLTSETSKSEPPHVSFYDNNDQFKFASIDEAIRELKAGRMIVVVDDEDRENEGDLTMAAEAITPEAINFMATHGRGLICLAMTGERLDELELPPMTPENSSLGGTAFTISIDVKGPGVTTGISAHDRAETIKAAVDPLTLPEDFGRPGHIFPLRARPGGVLERRGQTEAAVDLASLAGMYPAGVICEIVNDDGAMARMPDLIRFCRKHGLVMVTVADLARYRLDLDFEASFAAIDGLLPISAKYPALAARRFEPADLCLTGKG
jgi:3,4-dihydroxy-2-butanone 4-phosphate synthase/GTP cyclohydrolase II